MNSAEPVVDKNLENSVKEKLINSMLTLWVIIGSFLYITTIIRSMLIGWSIRDFMNTILLIAITVIYKFRKKIKTCYKAAFLIFTNLSIAVAGTLTLGMFAGGVFFFQMAAFILSLFYSKKTVWAMVTVMIFYLSALGYSFTTGLINLRYNADSMLRNTMVWIVFISCLASYFIFASQILISYLQEIRKLVTEIARQRDELSTAVDKINQLNRLLPICSSCKKIRDDEGYWNQVEEYIENHSGATFTHGLCPECLEKLYPETFIGQDVNS